MGNPRSALRPLSAGGPRRSRPAGRRLAALLSCGLALATVIVGPSPSAAAGSTERVAFGRQLPGGGSAAFTSAPDGADELPVDLPYVLEDFNTTTWSHDGRWLLHGNIPYDDPLLGGYTVFRAGVSRPDGSEFRLLAPPGLPPDMSCRAWSYDDTRLLCGLGGDVPGLFSLRADDGTDAVRLTTNPFGGQDIAVGLSPDGTRLAFLRYRPGVAKGPAEFRDEQIALFVANPDGSSARQLTPYGVLMPHELAGADWSPDGRTLVSSTPHGSLVLVRTDGGGVSPINLGIVGDNAFAAWPTFSPDGTEIMFSLFRHAPADLYRVRVDGTQLRQVTSTPDNEISADWAVVPPF